MKKTVVNLCDTYKVENTQGEEHVMILDPSALMNLAGRLWSSIYMAEFDYKIEDMVSSACYQVFRFGGIDKKHESKLFVEFQLMVKSAKGKDDVMKAYVYVIEADVTFSSWKKDFEKLGLNIKYKEKCFRDKNKRGSERLQDDDDKD